MNGESNWNDSRRELDRIDGEPMEFEWMMDPGHTALHILLEIQKLLKDLNCEPEQLKRKNHLHVDVQRHRVVRITKRTSMSC